MIDSKPISEEIFTKYFFEVWDALEQSAIEDRGDPRMKPVYFRFLTLLSFHIFLNEGVDVAIYEVGVGGAWDSTNIVEKPAVTGITTLGIDHVSVLGDTIEKIAWHKAGIFKPGRPAFTMPQVPEAAKVLQEQADEKGVALQTISVQPDVLQMEIIPNAQYQHQNASLAIALVESVLRKLHPIGPTTENLNQIMRRGIEETVWRGRCEIKIDGNRKWYLDGAHTFDSLRVAGSWFSQQCMATAATKVLVFNQQSRPEAAKLLKALQSVLLDDSGLKFRRVIFCTNVTRRDTGYGTG